MLHELYHHLAEVNELECPKKTEEKEANRYARDFLNSGQKRSGST